MSAEQSNSGDLHISSLPVESLSYRSDILMLP